MSRGGRRSGTRRTSGSGSWSRGGLGALATRAIHGPRRAREERRQGRETIRLRSLFDWTIRSELGEGLLLEPFELSEFFGCGISVVRRFSDGRAVLSIVALVELRVVHGTAMLGHDRDKPVADVRGNMTAEVAAEVLISPEELDRPVRKPDRRKVSRWIEVGKQLLQLSEDPVDRQQCEAFDVHVRRELLIDFIGRQFQRTFLLPEIDVVTHMPSPVAFAPDQPGLVRPPKIQLPAYCVAVWSRSPSRRVHAGR